jgi:hypothetical protein
LDAIQSSGFHFFSGVHFAQIDGFDDVFHEFVMLDVW